MGPPIFIGGKAFSCAPALPPWCRFNGATDFHRWKGPSVPRHARRRGASMGPPIFIGGKIALCKFLWGSGLGDRFRAVSFPSAFGRPTGLMIACKHLPCKVRAVPVFFAPFHCSRGGMGGSSTDKDRKGGATPRWRGVRRRRRACRWPGWRRRCSFRRFPGKR